MCSFMQFGTRKFKLKVERRKNYLKFRSLKQSQILKLSWDFAWVGQESKKFEGAKLNARQNMDVAVDVAVAAI